MAHEANLMVWHIVLGRTTEPPLAGLTLDSDRLAYIINTSMAVASNLSSCMATSCLGSHGQGVSLSSRHQNVLHWLKQVDH